MGEKKYATNLPATASWRIWQAGTQSLKISQRTTILVNRAIPIYLIMNKPMENISKIPDKKSIHELHETLKKRGFSSTILDSEKEVKDFINSNIPDKCAVGLGDSITTCRLNIRNILNTKGSTIFYSWDGSENYNRSLDTFDIQQAPAYYLTRISALTLSGDILMKDFSKQAAMEEKFPAYVFAFTGLNRVVEELKNEESILKYPVIKKCPAGVKFTVALLPFLDY
jgi:hypothetical protein